MRRSTIHPLILERIEGTFRRKWDLLADHKAEGIHALERAIRELSLLADLPGLGFVKMLSPKYENALAEIQKINPEKPPDRRRLLAIAEELRELDQFIATSSRRRFAKQIDIQGVGEFL